MIEYRYPEEKDFLLHYAKKLNKPDIEEIICVGEVNSSEEANALSSFFCVMVDETAKDNEQSAVIAGQTDLETLNEYVFESIRAYLRNNGYEKEWHAHV